MFDFNVERQHGMTIASLRQENESGDRDDVTTFAAFFMSFSGTVTAVSIHDCDSNDLDVEEITAILDS